MAWTLNDKLISLDSESRLYHLPVPIVGLTGGIATGKSTVTEIFKKHNLAVICADTLIKRIYTLKVTLEFMRKNFKEVVTEETINFPRLRGILFENPEKLMMVEKFLYSQLDGEFIKEFKLLGSPPTVIYDAPLLFEKRLESLVDITICVHCTLENQRKRITIRDNNNSELIEQILAKQMGIDKKIKLADACIDNNGTLEELANRSASLIDKIFIQN